MSQQFPSVAERIWRFVEPEPNTGCWLWTGSADLCGYGMIGVERKLKRAHRVMFEMHRGPIGAGLTLDHLCRVRCCVNPDHLEPVTLRENILRGDTIARRHAAKTHCVHGHAFTPENTYAKGNGRQCKTCTRSHAKLRWQRMKRRSA